MVISYFYPPWHCFVLNTSNLLDLSFLTKIQQQLLDTTRQNVSLYDETLTASKDNLQNKTISRKIWRAIEI